MAYNQGFPMQGQHPFNPSQYHPPQANAQLHHGNQYPMGQQDLPAPGWNYQPSAQMPVVEQSYPAQSQYAQQPSYPPQQTAPYVSQAYPAHAQYPHETTFVPQQFPSTSQSAGLLPTTVTIPWIPKENTKYKGPGIADKDASENDPEEKEIPTAPEYDLIVPGYEKMGSKAPFKPPPSYEESLKEAPPAMIDVGQVPAMDAEVARQALLQLVMSECCWGKSAARKMEIKDIQATCAYHYALETFTEGRRTDFTHVPYKGDVVDTPHVGPAPLPWDIPCKPKSLFINEQRKIPVPHTEAVRPCHLCKGRGYNRCRICRGRGKLQCGKCHGKGKVKVTNEGEVSTEETCKSCQGNGRKCCGTCEGAGCVQCKVCKGYGSVKHFIQLTVSFTNRHDYYILEKSDLPSDLIKGVQGDTIFTQTAPRVSPVNNFFEQEVNQKSKELVSKHAKSWLNERILQQKHCLRAVPVHECFFEFKTKTGRFWVFGHDRKVFTTDYPHTCCCCRCCCTVL